jgi:hypothetical protein
MVDTPKCPICNNTVPFSLGMHMQMVHGTSDTPPINKGKARFIDDPTARPMNEKKPAAARKFRTMKKPLPRPPAY